MSAQTAHTIGTDGPSDVGGRGPGAG